MPEASYDSLSSIHFYSVSTLIGEGAFGKVWSGRHRLAQASVFFLWWWLAVVSGWRADMRGCVCMHMDGVSVWYGGVVHGRAASQAVGLAVVAGSCVHVDH